MGRGGTVDVASIRHLEGQILTGSGFPLSNGEPRDVLDTGGRFATLISTCAPLSLTEHSLSSLLSACLLGSGERVRTANTCLCRALATSLTSDVIFPALP